jgi:hypothetical protein
VKESSRVLALFLLVIIEAIFEPIDLSLSLSLFQCLSSSFFIKKIAPRDDEALFITHDAVQYREFIPISLSLL